MAKFAYKATNAEGAVVDGVGQAPDQFALGRELKGQGLNIISATALHEAPSKFNISIPGFGGIKMHDKIIFARNLATMLRAGLALSRALTIMSRQSKNPRLKKTLDGINDSIRTGASLRDALAKYPKVFSSLFVSMVAAGEESGKLADSLDVIASQTEKTYLLQKKIKGALMYPSVIVFAMLVIGTFMLLYIVPTLVGVFEELSVELPLTTRMIIGASEFAQANGLLLLGVAVVLAFIGRFVFRTKGGKRFLDAFVLRIPLVSPLYKETMSARTARTLSSLLASGVPVVQALQIVEDTVGNSYYKEVLQKARKNIQVGMPISSVFIDADRLYPVFVGEMMAVGEETGELGHMLLNVAEFYEEEVDQKTKDMSTIIEPFLMLMVGAAVGLFAVSMISPMYSLVENL